MTSPLINSKASVTARRCSTYSTAARSPPIPWPPQPTFRHRLSCWRRVTFSCLIASRGDDGTSDRHDRINIVGGGIVQWNKSLGFVTGRVGYSRTLATAANALGLLVRQQPQTNKVPRVTSTPSAVRTHIWAHALGHIPLFPPSLARLPISLFLAAYTGYTPACYRAAIAQRSKHRRHFKVRHCLLVFPELVSVFIYRRELSYRTSMRRNSTTNWSPENWQRSCTFSTLNSAGSHSTGHSGGTRRALLTSRSSCEASLSRNLADLLVPPTCDTCATLW